MPRKDESRTVFTTESGRICPTCGRPVAQCTCKKKPVAPAGDGVVRVSLDKRSRAGKTVTVITGLRGSEETLRALITEIKRRCGTGGTLKDNIVEIQGDHRDLLVDLLKSKGLNVKRAGG